MSDPAPRLPVVAIVGRPNVGKSTFLNAVVGRRACIEDPTPGTTRDRIVVRARHRGRELELVDTGGITDPAGSPMDAAVRKQVDLAIAQADAIIFLCDARDGLTPEDTEIVPMLRKSGRPIILGVNKVDAQKHEAALADFFRLGLGDPIPITARQRLGVSILLDQVYARLGIDPEAATAAEGEKPLPPMKLAIVGKQNVGKSTLVNVLAGEERVIVSEVPGTTRDSVDVHFRWEGREFIAIDTAGLRKKGKVIDPIEYHSRMRTDASLKRADVVLFLLDAAMRVSDVDKKIVAEIDAQAKPVVIGINKYDLVEERNRTDKTKLIDLADYARYVARTLPALSYAPIALLSALKGKNVFECVTIAMDLYRQAHERIPTSRLNDVVEKAKDWPGPRSRRRGKAKILYATQTAVGPPTIVLFVNDPDVFPPDYRRNLANRFRSQMLYPEIPIRLEFSRRRRGTPEERRAKRKVHEKTESRNAKTGG